MYKTLSLLLFVLTFNVYSDVRLLDNTFGTKGISSLVSPYKDLAVNDTIELRDGKILFVGSYRTGSRLVTEESGYLIGRLNVDGTTDYSFGTNGYLKLEKFTTLNEGMYALFRALNLFPAEDGGFYIVGVDERPANNDQNLKAVLVSKHLNNGNLDESFGTSGVVHLTSLDSPSNYYNFSAVMDENEGITVTGLSSPNDDEPSKFKASRITPDGLVDQKFGDDGTVVLSTTATYVDQAGESYVMSLSDFQLAENNNALVFISKATPRFGRLENSQDSWKLFLQVYNKDGEFQNEHFIDLHGLSSGYKVLLDDDDNISIGGLYKVYLGVSEFGILKLNLNGQVKSNFGTNGLAHFNVPDNPHFEYPSYNFVDFSQRRDGTYIVIGTKYLGGYLFAATLDINGTLSSLPVDIEIGKLVVYKKSLKLMDEMNDGGFIIRGNGNKTSHFIKFDKDSLRQDSYLSQGKSYLTNFEEIRKMKLLKGGSILVGGFGTVTENHSHHPDIAIISKLDNNGELDKKFGQNGYAPISYGDGITTHSQTIFDIETDQDEAIISAGILRTREGQSLFVFKSTPDGEVDASFGEYGLFEFDPMTVDEKYTHAFANSILIMDDSSIIVAGYLAGQDSANAIIIKLTPDGTLDMDFDGNGYYIFDIQGKRSYLYDLTISNDVSFIASGNVSHSNGTDVLAVKLNSSGMPDKEFGENGVSIIESAQSNESVYAIESSADNQAYYLAGHGYLRSSDGPIIQRPLVISISNDGNLNNDFGDQGFKYLDWGKFDLNHGHGALTISRDTTGNLLVAGYADRDPSQWTLKSNIAVAALKPDGSLISSFGNNGTLYYNFEGSVAWDILPASSDSLFLAGSGFGVGLVTKVSGYVIEDINNDSNNDHDDDASNEVNTPSGGAISAVFLWCIFILFTYKFIIKKQSHT